jgi:hypothetical protein
MKAHWTCVAALSGMILLGVGPDLGLLGLSRTWAADAQPANPAEDEVEEESPSNNGPALSLDSPVVNPESEAPEAPDLENEGATVRPNNSGGALRSGARPEMGRNSSSGDPRSRGNSRPSAPSANNRRNRDVPSSSSRRDAGASRNSGRGVERSPRNRDRGAEDAANAALPAFKLIAERNIFDTTRSPRSSRGRTEEGRAAPAETVTLVGILSYEKGSYAFFDGSSSQHKKVLEAGATLIGYKLAEITPDAVKLQASTNTLELRIGMKMRKGENGWELPESEIAMASARSGANVATSNDSNADEAEIVKRMMQRREEDLK